MNDLIAQTVRHEVGLYSIAWFLSWVALAVFFVNPEWLALGKNERYEALLLSIWVFFVFLWGINKKPIDAVLRKMESESAAAEQ